MIFFSVVAVIHRTSLVEIRQVSWKREGMSCKVRILSQLSSVVFSCPDIQRSEPLGAEFSNRMKRLLAFIPKVLFSICHSFVPSKFIL